jgi:two-component system, cell cycle sensor histidine kinase and response regulator CckA
MAQSAKTFILLVDDDPTFLQLVRMLLMKHGYTVMLATEGQTALRLSRCHQGPIHLLLSDVVMPKMSGPSLAEQLLTQRPDMPVLFMSGLTNAAVIPSALRQRSSFVEKVPPLDGLVSSVQDILRNSRTEAKA